MMEARRRESAIRGHWVDIVPSARSALLDEKVRQFVDRSRSSHS
jgi:hypothetical protein